MVVLLTQYEILLIASVIIIAIIIILVLSYELKRKYSSLVALTPNFEDEDLIALWKLFLLSVISKETIDLRLHK